MSAIKLTNEKAEQLYHDMLLCRKFEEKCASLYAMKKIAGFLHLYIGQEAIAAGFNLLKKPQDSHITSYRCHAHALLQGELDPKEVMAELTGRGTGSSKGKGGSMHIYSKEKNFFGGNGIVGAQIPLGTGLAFYHNYIKDNGVSVSYVGDGGVPQGQVYEAFNMASLWKLPAVFVIENNLYSMGTPLSRTHACPDLWKRGEPFGIKGERIEDGMDVMKVMEVAERAIEHARSGKGPYLIEIKTYRFRGHSMSDPQKYRTKEEIEDYRNHHDPITIFEKYALENNLITQEKIKEISNKIKSVMKDVEEFALNSPEPSAEELYTDILV